MKEYQILGKDIRITFSALCYMTTLYFEEEVYLFVNDAWEEVAVIPASWEIQIVENGKIVVDNRL